MYLEIRLEIASGIHHLNIARDASQSFDHLSWNLFHVYVRYVLVKTHVKKQYENYGNLLGTASDCVCNKAPCESTISTNHIHKIQAPET